MRNRSQKPGGGMPLLAILLVAGIVATLFLTRPAVMTPHHERRAPGLTAEPRTQEPPGLPSLPGPAGVKYETADRLASQGQWRAAQDEYLKILLMNPGDSRAMQGLVTTQRRITNDDPATLRARAEAYRRAAGGRAETPEHYTLEGFRVLYVANLMAAAQANAARAAKTAARPTEAPVARRIEPAPAVSVRPGPAKNPAMRTTAVPAHSGGPAIPAQAVPQLQPYRPPASPSPSRPNAPTGTAGGPAAPRQFVALERPLPERSVGMLQTVDCNGHTFGI